MTYTQRKKIMPNSNESATEMSFEEDSCSVGESASNIDYGEVRLVAWEPYQDDHWQDLGREEKMAKKRSKTQARYQSLGWSLDMRKPSPLHNGKQNICQLK